MIYARVSVDKGSKSVEDQISECRAVAEREGWEVLSVVPEAGSASRHAKKDRERWPEAAELIQSRRVDMLMTWEFTRATRDLGFYVALRNACVKGKVKWWYGGTVYDMSDRNDRFRTGLDALRAEDEVDQISERSARGARQGASRGRPAVGPASYGYRRLYDPHSGTLLGQEPDPETAQIVRWMAERILAGESIRSVVRKLNDQGIPSPRGKQWNPANLRSMISRPGLAGIRTHHGKNANEEAWEPILTRQQHDDLVELMSDRRSVMDNATRHLLTGIAMCGVCGEKVRRLPVNGDPKYQCKAFCVVRKQALVDEVVTRAVLERLSRDDAADLFLPDRSEDVRLLRKGLASLRRQLEECYQQAEADDEDERLTPLGLARMERKLLPQIEDAEKKLRKAHLSPLVSELIDGGPAEVWEGWEVTQRRTVVRELMTVTILPTGRTSVPGWRSIRIEWNSPENVDARNVLPE